MAETHELRLKINAAAARAGAREFVAALNSIKSAVRQLDRDSNGVFTRLNKNLKDIGRGSGTKLNIVDRTSLRNLQSYSKLAQDAIKNTANTSRSVANLATRMQGLSASYATARGQADAYTNSLTRLNAQLSRQAGAPAPRTAAAPAGGGASRAGADQAVADQTRVQRAVEQTRLSVERLTTQLMKVGGFQSINNLGIAFRDFQRQASSGTMSAADFTRAMGGMRSAITNSQTALTTLNAKTRDQANADRAAVKSANERARALDAANAATNRAMVETAGLTNRLRAVGDTRGIDALNNAMLRLRSSLSGSVGSVQQVKNATTEFTNATTRLRVGLLASEGAAAGQARSTRQVAAAAASAAAATKALERDMRSAAGAANAADKSFRNATGGMRGLENAFSGGFQAASLFRTALGSITLGTFTQSVFAAGDALQQFNITMEVASGSAEAAADDLQYINDMAARLGTNLNASRAAFSKFAVSSQIAGVSGDQTRQIFESVSTAMAVLGRNTEDQNLAFLALEQMMSKGVISAEELRRQLGERLPGAVNLMAKAVGVSTSELQDMLKAGELISSEVLPKFARELDKTFGSQLNRTFNRAGSNLGRLQTEFTKVLEIIANSGFMDSLSNQFRDLTSLMRSADVREAAANLGRGLADAADIAGSAIQYIITNIDTIGAVVKNVIGGIILAQFARFGQALLLGGQQMLIAGNAMRSLGATSAVASGQIASAGMAATTATGRIAGMGAAATATAAAGGRMGLAFGALGRIFGVLAGPVGIAVSALTLVPMFLNRIEDESSAASAEYEDAMRRMGTSTFYFLDIARELDELSPFEQFNANLPLLREAQEAIAEFSTSADMTSALNAQFDSLSNLGGGDFRASIGELQAAFEDLRSTADIGEQAEKVAEIKKQIADLVLVSGDIDGAFDGFKGLQDTVLDGVRAIMLANSVLEEQTDIAGTVGAEVTKLTAEFARLQDKVVDAGGDIQGSIDDILQQLYNMGSNGDILTLQNEFENLLDTFDGSAASVSAATAKFEELRAKFTAIANDSSLPEWMRDSANQMLALVGAAEDDVAALGDLEAQADATAQEIVRLSGEIDGSAGSMRGAAGAAYEFAGSLNAIRDARREIDSLTSTADVERARDLEIAQLRANGQLREAAILQDRYSGATSRLVADLNKQRDAAIAAANELATGTNDDGIGAPDGVRAQAAREVQAIEAEIAEQMRIGAEQAGKIFDLRQQSSGSGGSSKAELTALQELMKAGREHITSLEAQNQANILLASGMTTSASAARMLGEAFANGVSLTNEQTMAFIGQIEAAEQLNEALTRLANDPVNDWMDSVPTWREAGQAIEADFFGKVSGGLAQFLKDGEFTRDAWNALGESMLETIHGIIADKAIKELATLFTANTSGTGEGGFGLGGLMSDLFGNGGSAGDPADPLAAGFDGQASGQQIMMAMTQGGQQAAAAIQQAMVLGAQQISSGMSMGGVQAGAQVSAQVSTGMATGAATAAPVLSGGVVTGAATAAPMLTAATAGGATSGASIGADLLAAGVESGSETGGGFFANLLGGLFGGGGGGAGGGIASMAMSFLPALFGSGGGVVGGGGPAIPSVMAPAAMFNSAPKFAMGTPNTTGGVPAILHANEAVVPLTGGRKIPIDGDIGGGGGGQTVVQNFNITTPNADSFRKSQSQIAADAAASGQRAMSRNR